MDTAENISNMSEETGIGHASKLVKLKGLKVGQLNVLLQNQGLEIKGNKSHKISKLVEALGSDEISAEELDEDREPSAVNKQLGSLQKLVQSLTETVNKLVTDNQSKGNAATTEETITVQAAAIATEVRAESISVNCGAEVGPRTASVEAEGWPVYNAVPAKHKVADIIGVLPEFDPIKGNITACQFIGKINQLREIYSWSEAEVLFSVQHALKGVAKEWVDCQPVFSSWPQFVNMLTMDFPSEVNVVEVHREMSRRRKKPTESLKEFYYAMLNMGRRGKLDERSICSYIIAGLNEANLSRTLQAMDIRSCTELLRSLENLAQVSSTMKQPPDDKSAISDPEKKITDRRQVRCFNCNVNGHIAAKCPQPIRKPRCSKCNKFGHDSKICRSEKSTVAKIAENVSFAPPVLKNVIIAGGKFAAFVDTGSDFSLISEHAVPVAASREHTTKRLQGFGGAIVQTRETTELEIEMDNCKFLASLIIVPSNLMTHDLLIGRDIICREDSQIVIEAGVMRVQPSRKKRFNINASLTEAETREVTALLDDFEVCFSEDLSGLGRCLTTEMEIVVTTDKPIVGKRYQVPFAQRPALSAIVDNLLNHGIIRPSSSPHAAPVVLVKKANGEDRMCVDFRALNAVTIKKQFPMPVVEEQLMKLAGNQFFTALDLTSGYYQIPLKEESKGFTAFFTPEGLYEHNVMPFGLVNAPMVFQEVILRIIRDLKHRDSVVSYVDEVLIATKTIKEGLQVLEEFLRALCEARLTLRPSKCVFMATEVKFLGHIVSRDGIRPGAEKTECVANFPRPKNGTETRQFLGLTGFFRRFIERYGEICKPLTKLLKKEEEFRWTDEQEFAFNKLKQVLISMPILTMFDQTKEHEVHTDASSLGIAGVLLQEEAEGFKPVHYYSRQCSTTEANYASHELEVLAIVETLERFRLFLLGTRFTVVTDCNAVATTKATTLLRPRIARWWLRLQEFDFRCINRAGVKMAHVDSMSRAPLKSPEVASTVAESVMRVGQATPVTQDWVFALQLQDEKIQEIVGVLNGSIAVEDRERRQYATDYSISNGRLYRKVSNQLKLVIPRAVRWRVVKACHDDAGHSALEKTLQRVQKNFWFPRMRRYVKSYIAACDSCCFNKVKGGKAESQLHTYDVTPLPFLSLFVDHLGPFPRSRSGNLYVLVIVCGFTKYVLLKALKNTKTGPVVKTLEEMMSIFGQPKRITSDRGTAYTSAEFQKFVDKHGVQHVKAAVRTPRANGQAERVNKTLINALKCSTTDAKDWDTTLLTIQWALNSQPSSVTKFSPNELVFHFNPRDVAQNRIIQALHVEDDNCDDADVKWREAAENIMKERQKWKVRYDQKHQRPKVYKVGDLVVTNYIPSATGTSHKLDPVYKGPYVVTKVLSYDRYIVEDLPDSSLTQRRYSGVLSSDHLKPWCSHTPELDGENQADDTDDDSDNPPGTVEGSGEAELSTPLANI